MANAYWLKRWSANVYAAELNDSDAQITGERDLGHCTVFTMAAPSTEDFTEKGRGIDNYDQTIYSESGSLEQEIKITTKSDNVKNMAIMMFGEATEQTQSAGNDASAINVTAYHDEWTKTDKRNLDPDNAPVVQDDTDTTTYVEGTDYEVDYVVGRIKALSTGSISDGDTLHVTRTWLALTTDEIEANRNMNKNFFLRVIGKDMVDDVYGEWEIDKVHLKPSGDINKITEPGDGSFQEFEMTGVIITTGGKQWREIRHRAA